jgi:hypothetical protein
LGVAAFVAVLVVAGIAFPLSGLRDIGERENVGSIGTRVRPIGFEPVPGWSMAMIDPADEPAQVVYVTNGPFAPIDLEGSSDVDGVVVLPIGAERTLRTLPDDGILISASVVYRSPNPLPPDPDFSDRLLPWRLPPAPPETSWEGDAEGLSRYTMGGATNGRFVVVNVYFGAEEPGADVVALAQAELERLVVDPAPPPTQALDGFGLAIDPPASWDGRLYAWASSPPILELSTIPLGGHTPGDPMIPNRAELENTGDASIVLAESDVLDPGYAPARTPVSIGAEDRCDSCEVLDDGTVSPPGHALFHRAFENGGRSFDLYVEFGSEPGTSDLARVNDVLAALVIHPAPGVEPQTLLELPSGWFQLEDPLPALIRPRIVVAAGSWRFPSQPLIACGPQPALADMPPDRAFVWIVRYSGDVAGADPWPERFTLDLPSRPGDAECAAGTDGSVRQYSFDGPERIHYQVLVALGTEVDDAMRREVEQVVSSFSP